jgi:hypothetical protein
MKTIACLVLFLAIPAMALPDKPEKGVVYVEEFAPKGIKLKVEKPGWVYSTKQGGRKRGSLKIGINVELVSFTEKAYFVRGNVIMVSEFPDGSPQLPFLPKTQNLWKNSSKFMPDNFLFGNSLKKRSRDRNDTRRSQQNPHPPDQN